MASADSNRTPIPLLSRSKALSSSSRITCNESGSSLSARRTLSRSTANSPISRAPLISGSSTVRQNPAQSLSAPLDLVAHRGKRIIETPRRHPVHHQLLDVPPAARRIDSPSPRQFILPLQNLQLVFPMAFGHQKPHLLGRSSLAADRTLLHLRVIHGVPSYADCSVRACVAGNFSLMRRRRRPLLRNFQPRHRNHASSLFVRQSQRESTLVAQPVVLNAMRGPASPVRPLQLSPFDSLRFHQKQFPLTQLAEGDGASWIGAFVQHARPPESAVLNQSEHRGCTPRTEMSQPWTYSNRFQYFSLHAYLLRLPKLKCPTAVSVAEISAAAVIMKRHAQDRLNVPAHFLRRS